MRRLDRLRRGAHVVPPNQQFGICTKCGAPFQPEWLEAEGRFASKCDEAPDNPVEKAAAVGVLNQILKKIFGL